MPEIFRSHSWALKVLDSWVIDDDEQSVAFVPEGIDDAALVISAFHKDSEITMDEMREMIQSDAHEGTEYSEARLGEFTGFHTTYTSSDEEGDVAWRIWCVFCRTVHLYVTYNCTVDERGKDDADVDEMLRTLMCMRAD